MACILLKDPQLPLLPISLLEGVACGLGVMQGSRVFFMVIRSKCSRVEGNPTLT